YSLPSIVDVNLLSFIIEGLIAKQNIKNYYELVEQNGPDEDSEKQLNIQYLDKSVVLIILKRNINVNCFNELKKCFMKMVEQKIPHIAIQLGNITDIDNIMVNLLVNFQKKADENGSNLCFCSIGKKIPGVLQNYDALKSVHVFNKESDIIEYFSSKTV
ncbi:MAG: STAS domain-containing protein, partial [Chitinispirillia bacterium]